MPRYMTRQGDSMRLTPFAPGLFNEKPLNLENTTSSVLSVLLSIYDNIVVLYSFQKVLQKNNTLSAVAGNLK